MQTSLQHFDDLPQIAFTAVAETKAPQSFTKPPANMTQSSDRQRSEIESQLFASAVDLIRISQLFCSAPLGFTLQSLSAHDRPKLSKRLAQHAQHAWSAVYMLLMLVCTLYHRIGFAADMHVVEGNLYTVSYIMTCINIAIVLVGTGRQRAGYANTFKRMVCIDLLFDELLPADAIDRLQYARIGRSVRRDLLLLVIMMGITLSFDFYHTDSDWLSTGHIAVIYNMSNLTLCTCLMQYVFVLRVLSARYALLGQLLGAALLATEDSIVEHAQLERTLHQLRRLYFQLGQLNATLTQEFGALLIGNILAVCLVLMMVFFQFYLISTSTERFYGEVLGVYWLLWMIQYLARVAMVLWHNDLVNRRRGGLVVPLNRVKYEQRKFRADAVNYAVCIFCISLSIICIICVATIPRRSTSSRCKCCTISRSRSHAVYCKWT